MKQSNFCHLKITKFILAATLTNFCLIAQADSIVGPKTVKSLYSNDVGTAGFYMTEGAPQCLYEIIYVDLTKPSGKAQLSMLMLAKATNQKLSLINYNKDSNNICMLTSLHVE